MTGYQCSPVLLRPFHVGVDWLTWHGRGPVTAFEGADTINWTGPGGENWRLIRQTGTAGRHPVYDAVFYLLCPVLGKLMTLCMKPVRGAHAKGRPDLMHWQFSNSLLAGHLWQPIQRQMFEMGFIADGLSRLDIALDGLRPEFDPLVIVDAGLKGTDGLRYFGKCTWSPRMEANKVAGFTMGSRSGNKYLRVYHKSRELKSVQGQHKRKHFEAIWSQRIGREIVMKEGTEVMRFEMQLKGKELTRYMGDVDAGHMEAALTCDAGLLSILSSTTRTVFDYRFAKEGGRARDAVPAVAWDFSRINDAVDCWGREPRKATISENSLKVAAKVLFMLGSTNGDVGLINDARRVAEFGSLSRWFDDAQTRWAIQWAKLMDTGGARMDELATNARRIARKIDGE